MERRGLRRAHGGGLGFFQAPEHEGHMGLTIVPVIVPVAASVLVPLLIYVSEDGDAACVYPTKGGAGRGIGRRRGCTHNHEHMIILSKRRQVAPAAAGLESVGKRRVLAPAAGF